MVIFGTFKGFRNNSDGMADLIFNNLNNEIGDKLKGQKFYKQNIKSRLTKLKFGKRYAISLNDLNTLTQLRRVKTKPKCDIFRRFKDEIHFIGGKFQGKKDNELTMIELSNYCIWLGYNSYNEATIRNSLIILKKIHE